MQYNLHFVLRYSELNPIWSSSLSPLDHMASGFLFWKCVGFFPLIWFRNWINKSVEVHKTALVWCKSFEFYLKTHFHNDTGCPFYTQTRHELAIASKGNHGKHFYALTNFNRWACVHKSNYVTQKIMDVNIHARPVDDCIDYKDTFCQIHSWNNHYFE